MNDFAHVAHPAQDGFVETKLMERERIAALFDLPFFELLMMARSVHGSHHRPDEIQLSTLLSIKTGGCAEDCGYCSQSASAESGVKAEKLMDVEAVISAAAEAKASGSTRFCMGAAWREPKERDMPKLLEMVRSVKAMGLESCMTLGMLTQGQANALADAGLDYYNHNIDTSPDFYSRVITTRTFQDRLDTLSRVRSSGIAVCCGGIMGMGETREDRIAFSACAGQLARAARKRPSQRAGADCRDGPGRHAGRHADCENRRNRIRANRGGGPDTYARKLRAAVGRPRKHERFSAGPVFPRGRKFDLLWRQAADNAQQRPVCGCGVVRQAGFDTELLRRSDVPLRTRITDLFGIRYPIIQGGMQNVGYARLAAAVSQAGGLGMITALTFADPKSLASEIELCAALTDAPFGVNISVFPTMHPPDYAGIVDAIADAGITIVETAGTPAVREVWDLLLARDIKIIHKCTSIRHALSSERYGVDAVSIDGFECAGHPGEDDVPGLVLIPAAVDKLRVPVVASGGIADGRGLAAALALGAEGVNMGTRFCATREAPIHDRVKRAYVENTELDTDVLFRPFRNSARVGRNAVSQEVLRRTAEPGATFADVADLVSGMKGKALLETGDIDSGVYWASMAQGLIHDIPTCAELIRRIVAETREIITGRLAGMIEAGA